MAGTEPFLASLLKLLRMPPVEDFGWLAVPFVAGSDGFFSEIELEYVGVLGAVFMGALQAWSYACLM